jgi:hypothetical protein
MGQMVRRRCEIPSTGPVIPQYQALWQEQQAIRLATPETGVAFPDPRYMDPTQAFAAWPSGTFDLSRRLRPDPMAATTDLRSLVRFTAPSLPGDLDEVGIAELLAEPQRRGEATARELIDALKPARRGAGKRAVLWLMRVGLAMVAEG